MSDDLPDGTQVIDVGPGLMLDFETGAVLEALLMFPAREEIDIRREAFLALCACFASEQQRSVPEEADYLRKIRPAYFEVPKAQQRAVLRKLKTALRHRLVAGLMARPFVGQAKLGAAYKPPPGLVNMNPSLIAEWVAAKHNLKSRDNLLHRVWCPSLPVLPLCIGLDNAMLVTSNKPQAADAQIAPVDAVIDLEGIDIWKSAVCLGHEALEIVRSERKIRIPDRDIVRIYWHE